MTKMILNPKVWEYSKEEFVKSIFTSQVVVEI
jgi:hypothetical protein